jgi:hypothetical protein
VEAGRDDRLAAIDASTVGAGLHEAQGGLDLTDLQGAHLEERDVEAQRQLLGGALFFVGDRDGLPRQRLAERAALLT